MVPRRIKSPKAAACAVFGMLFLAGVIVLFIMGGIFYGQERPKVLNYANDMCTVNSRSVATYQCKSRYYYYTCYGPTWNVIRGADRPIFSRVEGSRRYSSYYDAMNKANEYQIGSSYSCWYDTRNPSVAQWDKPSTTVAIILLCCGALSLLLTILMFFLTRRLIQQEIMQTGMDMPPAYTVTNPYGKH